MHDEGCKHCGHSDSAHDLNIMPNELLIMFVFGILPIQGCHGHSELQSVDSQRILLGKASYGGAVLKSLTFTASDVLVSAFTVSAGNILIFATTARKITKENIPRSTYSIHMQLLLQRNAFVTLPTKPDFLMNVIAYVTFPVRRSLVLGYFNLL